MRIFTKMALISTALLSVCLSGCNIKLLEKPDESSTETTAPADESSIMIIPSTYPEEVTINIPTGFSERSSQYCNKFYARDDATILVDKEPQIIQGIRLDEYKENAKKIYQETAVNYTLLSESEEVINSRPAFLLEFTYDIPAEERTQTMHALVVLFMIDNNAYAVTCKSFDEHFIGYRNVFNMALASIKIAEPSETTTVDVTATTNATT